jgi:hypothetical protein
VSRLRPRLTYANVVATLALVIAIGGASAFAASQLGKNSVGPKQLKKNSVTTPKLKNESVTAAKVKKGTLTGTQIDISTLGTVPSASHANSADNAVDAETLGRAPSGDYAKKRLEAVHLIGEPGEPEFENGASNTGQGTSKAAFYKDSFGFVHLQGTIDAPNVGQVAFTLPPGFRPASQICFATPAFVGGLTFKVNRACVTTKGWVDNDRGEGTEFSLDGFSFPPT